MAGRFSVYGANQVLNKVLRSTDFSVPASYWVALFRAANDTSLRANNPSSALEVSSGIGYVRKEVRGATALTFSLSTAAASQLSDIVSWDPATGSWGTVTYAALMDSATLGAGNVILYGALTVPKAVDNGDTFRIPSGLFTIGL